MTKYLIPGFFYEVHKISCFVSKLISVGTKDKAKFLIDVKLPLIFFNTKTKETLLIALQVDCGLHMFCSGGGV